MNLLAVIVILLLIVKILEGYKRGAVREIISFVSLIVLCAVAGLIGKGLESYFEKEYVGVAVAVLLLCVLGIAHHLLGLVFFSAKLITSLPIVHWLDKILGMAVGALEVVLILWTIYTFIMYLGLGMVGHQILAYTEENSVLLWLYQHNYLAKWISSLHINIPNLPI